MHTSCLRGGRSASSNIWELSLASIDFHVLSSSLRRSYTSFIKLSGKANMQDFQGSGIEKMEDNQTSAAHPLYDNAYRISHHTITGWKMWRIKTVCSRQNTRGWAPRRRGGKKMWPLCSRKRAEIENVDFLRRRSEIMVCCGSRIWGIMSWRNQGYFFISGYFSGDF